MHCREILLEDELEYRVLKIGMPMREAGREKANSSSGHWVE